MAAGDEVAGQFGLGEHGISPRGDVLWNVPPPVLVEQALRRGDAMLAATGALSVTTPPYTGRAPNDRYLVREATTEADIWWGDVNVPLSPESWTALRSLVADYLSARDLWVQDVVCGADPDYAIATRVVSESPWHALFTQNMFLPPAPGAFEPEWTILHAPGVQADPNRHGTRSGAFVVLNLAERTVLIGGTRYAGEVKKSMFSVMNHRLPGRGVLPMHCSANVGPEGDVAIFFGLSGTGKTTLSTDPHRRMIGDDEHGWSDEGVFNFEGGSYAKVIRISEEDEPLIYKATNSFGAIIENVILDPVSRVPDFDDDAITENTRSSYPLELLANVVPEGRGGHARNVTFLTADAFGILPPISRLTREQAMYYFLAGYTAKVAGTEGGVKEPQATFSPCFGAPFLPLPPWVYADLLGRRVEEHDARVWLVNTGWTGGPYGVGHRVPIRYTRAMLQGALTGALNDVATRIDPVFGLEVPVMVPEVPSEVLDPRGTWDDPAAYDAGAAELARRFHAEFEAHADRVSGAVRGAGPRRG